MLPSRGRSAGTIAYAPVLREYGWGRRVGNVNGLPGVAGGNVRSNG